MSTPRIPNGRQIRMAREARGWTQKQLIEQLVLHGYHRSIGQTAFSSIEHTRPVPRLMLGPLLRAMPELRDQPEDLAEAG